MLHIPFHKYIQGIYIHQNDKKDILEVYHHISVHTFDSKYILDQYIYKGNIHKMHNIGNLLNDSLDNTYKDNFYRHGNKHKDNCDKNCSIYNQGNDS